MLCPFCQHVETAVVDSRDTDNGEVTRRRRVCANCHRRFTTYEKVEGLELKVIKKDGSRQDFDREKVKRGLIKATWKRPVSLAQIDEVITEVETRIRQKGGKEIKSWEIGNLVINRLKKLDPLSYLLFASVYRDFNSLEDFASELQKILATQAEKISRKCDQQ